MPRAIKKDVSGGSYIRHYKGEIYIVVANFDEKKDFIINIA